MSVYLGKVVGLILKDCFGNASYKIGMFLHSHGANPLLYIKKGTGLHISIVKETLCILIKYGLVSFKPNHNKNLANYTLQHEKVLLILRYPKYVNLIKQKFGDEAEIIVEEILQSGCACASEIMIKTYNRLVKDHNCRLPFIDLRDKMQSLCIAKYIQRVPIDITKESPVPNVSLQPEQLFCFPEIDIKAINEKLNGAKVEMSDANIYWRVNFDRFHQDIRDNIIVVAASKKFDENAGELIRLLLQQMYIRTEPWAAVSNPVPAAEVKDIVRKNGNFPQLLAFFDQYISVIDQDNCGMIIKAGEAAGGSYEIQMKQIFTNLAWETAEKIVMEKFDSKAARIFRLVKSKKYIESHSIQKFAMIPDKEAKSLTYKLLEENFLDIYELKRPVQSGPLKSFTLFHIQLPVIVRMILEICYKALYNAMSRRNNVEILNKRIIDKRQRVDTILLSMKSSADATDQQISDIEDMITPVEKEILDNIELTMEKLNVVDVEIDDTIFLLKLFLEYNKMPAL